MLNISVKDFQAVKDVSLQIEGVTILKAPSNGGKSSTMKAIFEATHNRFASNQVRFGEDNAVVKLRWDNEQKTLTVTRSRRGGSPTMQLGDSVFSKLTRSVPTEVEEYNNFGDLKVGSDIFSLNFYAQFQKPLLVSYSQKKVRDILSASKGMDDLNVVYASLLKKRERNEGACQSVDSIINRDKADLSVVKFQIDDYSKNVDRLKTVKKEFDSLSEDIETAHDLKEDFNSYYKKKNRVDIISRILALVTQLEEVDQQYDSINSLKIAIDRKAKISSKVSLQNKAAIKAGEIIGMEHLYVLCNGVLGCFNKIAHKREITTARCSILGAIDKYSGLQHEIELYCQLYNALGKWKTISMGDKQKKLLLYKNIVDKQKEFNDFSRRVLDVSDLMSSKKTYSVLSNRVSSIKKTIDNRLCPVCGTPLAEGHFDVNN